MEPRSQTTAAPEPLPVPAEDLYRMAPEVYRGLVEHGVLNGPERVELVDGLLVVGPAGSDGASDPLDRLYRIPLEVYHGIADLGLLTRHDKTILLDGLLVKTMTKGNPHFVAIFLAMEAFRKIIPGGWIVMKEDPLALPSGPTGRASEPEPDITLVRGRIRDYLTRKPGPEDTALVVEVASTSLRKDRAGLKRYAWAGIPATWIIDLNAPAVEVYTEPTGPADPAGYRDCTTYGPGDEVPLVIEGCEVGRVAVNDLLP